MVPNTKQAFADAGLALKTPAQPEPVASGSRSPGDSVVHEGWLLKKRRKKLQGLYLRLYLISLLTYVSLTKVTLADISFSMPPAFSLTHSNRNLTFVIKYFYRRLQSHQALGGGISMSILVPSPSISSALQGRTLIRGWVPFGK